MNLKRAYDLVVFGATGFTGKHVVGEVQRIAKGENISWAIAGRNREKLSDVITQKNNENQDSFADIIIADVSDFQSLLMMCKQARVILDCVGPYKFFGEPVVKACIESNTDYVDVCGEPLFLESMVQKYNGKAEKTGVYVVGACGFDSIPSDLGVLYTKQKFDGTLNSIKGYAEMKWGPAGPGVHFGTFESAVNAAGDRGALKELRKTIQCEPLPMVGPRMKMERPIHYKSELEKYAFPFVEPDVVVVQRSQRYLYEDLHEAPIQYMLYSCVDGLKTLLLLGLFGIVFGFLATRAWGRSLLLKHPKFFTAGMFSHEGPTKEQMEQTSFSITMYGEGYSDESVEFDRTDSPNKKIVTRVSGPELAYVTTPIVMVQAALAIVKEREQLPPHGGVYSPGAAFYKTNLIKNLEKNGIRFEVLE